MDSLRDNKRKSIPCIGKLPCIHSDSDRVKELKHTDLFDNTGVNDGSRREG